jgi:5'-nucleotidase
MTRILVTNDDGVQAEGIRELVRALASLPEVEVVVVAPDREQSASGHSLTLQRPLRMHELAPGWYAVDGTPTDAVNLAVHWLLRERPADLVISGINNGLNLGADVTYSGTVSATFEASLLGLPAVAFSQEVGPGASFPRAAEFARRFVATLLADPLDRRLLLNVNLPAREVAGVEFARLGRRVYRQVVVEKEDPRGRRYFWIAGTPEWSRDAGTDHDALERGLASVTPLHLDLTDYRALGGLGDLALRLERQLRG